MKVRFIRCTKVQAVLCALLIVGALTFSADSLEAQEIDTTAPTFVSATTNGLHVAITFSEDIFLSPTVEYVMEKYGVPLYQFPKAVMDVTVDGDDDVLHDNVSISGNQLNLELAFSVGRGQVLTLSYDNSLARAGTIFVDSAGNAVPFFSDQPIQNNSTDSTVTDRTPDFVLSTDDLAIDEDGTGTYTVTAVGGCDRQRR